MLTEARAVAERSCEEQVSTYLEKKAEDVNLVLCGDFGWSQRRGASAGVYVLIDASTGRVLHQIILTKRCTRKVRGRTTIIRKGNYFGTSKGMEGEAFRRMLDCLDEKKLMPYFKVMVCDQDSSVLCQLREDLRTKHVTVVHDPGHTKKKLRQGSCAGLWPQQEIRESGGGSCDL